MGSNYKSTNMFSRLFKKPYRIVECGSFIVKFYYKEGNLAKTYLEITTVSGVWSMRIAGNTHAYAYLLEAANQDKIELIHNFVGSLLILSEGVISDRRLGADVASALDRWHERQSPPAEHKETRRCKEPKRRFNELKY